MVDKYLTAKEAAGFLGVSVQTLRNWDDNGYLKASRTIGGHRRYLDDDLEDFVRGKKKIEYYSCWELDHLYHLENSALCEGEKDSRAKECGGFTKSQIGLLLKNQDTAHDNETKKLNQDLDLFYRIASSFSSPYLFETKVSNNMSSLVAYKRTRHYPDASSKVVIESEDVCAVTNVESYWFGEDAEKQFKKIIQTIDSSCLEDIINNVSPKHQFEIKFNEVEETIEKVINLIDERTGFKEPKYVVYPPELACNPNGLIKLTDNLKVLGNDFSNYDYKFYVSRLIPDNKILIGSKSIDGFSGYVFAPYMIMCQDGFKNRFMMRVGKKFLREGSGFFGLITVKG